MSVLRDYHATIFVDTEFAVPIESIRRAWDPKMASAIPAHVTLVYPQEISTPQELIARVKEVSLSTLPFDLEIGEVSCFDEPTGGIYLNILDVHWGFSSLRERLLSAPFHPVPLDPHITLVHPRTSARGPELWTSRQNVRVGGRFTVTSMAITAYDRMWRTINEFELGEGA